MKTIKPNKKDEQKAILGGSIGFPLSFLLGTLTFFFIIPVLFIFGFPTFLDYVKKLRRKWPKVHLFSQSPNYLDRTTRVLAYNIYIANLSLIPHLIFNFVTIRIKRVIGVDK